MKIDYAQVKRFIIEEEIEKALGQLVIETNGTDYSMEVTLLSARHNRLRKEINTGVLDKDDANREKNQIIAAILDLLDRLEDDFLKNKMTYEWFRMHPMAWDEPYPDDYETIKDVKIFKSAETSTIGWMILLNYPPMVADFSFNFEWLFSYNKTPIMTIETQESVLPLASMSMYQGNAFAMGEVGDWMPGEYTFELYCRGKLIVSEAFTVI
jgi:Effector-associated domain 11